jgi:hypothetical protein
MAGNNHFIASIYRYGNTDATALFSPAGVTIPATQGILESFPSAGTHFYPVRYKDGVPVTACGVTMNSIIELLPTGLSGQGQSRKFYTDATVSTLNGLAT